VAARYEIRVYDHRTGNWLATYPMAALTALQYDRKLDDIGVLALTLPDNDDIDTIFALDNLIEVLRLNSDDAGTQREVEDTYLVRRILRYRDKTTRYATIGAPHLNHLLLRRVMLPDDDPLAAGGFITRAGIASDIMRDYAFYQIGAGADSARQIGELNIISNGDGESIGGRYRLESLFQVLKELAKNGRSNFHITRTTSNNLQLTCGRMGTDRTVTAAGYGSAVVLSPARGQLRNPQYTVDREDEANYVLILGSGRPGNQTIVPLHHVTTGDSNWNRIERTRKANVDEDASPLDLIDEGRLEIIAGLPKQEYTFELATDVRGGQYNVDWFLGDTVSIRDGSIAEDLRITSVSVQVSANADSVTAKVEKDNT
jgi:hypothetical protein